MSELELIAFLDESKKPVRDRATGRVVGNAEIYLVVAGVVFRGGVEDLRASVAQIQTNVGAPLHYSELTRSRRETALQAVAALDGWEAYIFEPAVPRPSTHREAEVRDLALRAALKKLASEVGILQVTLETRAKPTGEFKSLDQADQSTLASMLSRGEIPPQTRINHGTKSESLLALPDLIAGARSDYLANKSGVPYSLIGHMVNDIIRF